MERFWREGVIIGLMRQDFERCPTYRVWLLYEAEETTLECKTGRLKLGDWVAVPSSESGSDLTSFITIPEILPTEVTLGDIVWIQTTVVFDHPTKAERIEHDSFIVHARHFGRVAAFSSFSEAVAGVPYDGIRVQRIPEKFSQMGVSWFIPPQPLSHPSRMPFHQGAVFGPFDGVVVRRHANTAYFWTPLLGEGICLNGQGLSNGDWVKFFVPAWSLRRKFPNPNLHFQVAKWEVTDAILESFKCRNSVQVNTLEARPAHWNKTAVVLLERLMKSVQEPITVWNVKEAWCTMLAPFIIACLVESMNVKLKGWTDEERCCDDQFDGACASSQVDRTTRKAYDVVSRNTANYGWPGAKSSRNSASDGRPAANGSAINASWNQAYKEEEKLARAVDVMGILLENAEVRAAILQNCPADYAQLCRYYRFTP
ncbi:unnamed protein product [Toxocara canis]|uniref:UBC core domain-containing protein n=1 Tax=Toxocara canis TaxID=6265 RepID=A0A183TXY1_TOXCA|nr:unnamed protein product [Toxocara canis]